MNKFKALIMCYRRQLASLFLVLLVLIPFSIVRYIQNNWIVEPLSLGSQIPSAMVTTWDEKNVYTDSMIMKKTVIVFFSTTCPHCKIELHHLDSLYQEFKNEFEIIALSLNTQKETTQFVDELQISFSTYRDITGEAKNQFRVKPVPALFFINQRRQIVKYLAGEHRTEVLYSALVQFASLPNDSLFTLL